MSSLHHRWSCGGETCSGGVPFGGLFVASATVLLSSRNPKCRMQNADSFAMCGVPLLPAFSHPQHSPAHAFARLPPPAPSEEGNFERSASSVDEKPSAFIILHSAFGF